jgi:phosphoenolpyruvate carboxykinase (ATP)
MMEITQTHPGLEALGFRNLNGIYWQLNAPQLYEEAVRRKEGMIAEHGPLVVSTGEFTGRSPKDKFVVREPGSEQNISWGNVNQPISPDHFDRLHTDMLTYFEGRDAFVQDLFAGADDKYRLPVRIITEGAWWNLFARNMFVRPTLETLEGFIPGFTVIQAPGFDANPEVHGTRTKTFIVVNFAKKIVLIGGTEYAGEIKKSIFSVMNYLLPLQGIMPMHCSANEGTGGGVALFFGLSGTGKTTLSSDSTRILIGDDEHGWSDQGVFNFEGGCYAKVIRLSPTGEPEIYQTTRQFGTILENVVIDGETRLVDLDSDKYTENTRSSYPISQVLNASSTGVAGHPQNVIFLTADAFGVMPPISRLTRDQAMYHFLSGYTAKVAGTERGLQEPQATFSACFGAPFMPMHPSVYADLLGKKIDTHNAKVWLVNTGWTGGPYGEGKRMSLTHTRAIIHAILDSKLDNMETRQDAIFGLHIPLQVPGVPDEVLDPRQTWADKGAYDAQAQDLTSRFRENFKQYEENVTPAVAQAGPPG